MKQQSNIDHGIVLPEGMKFVEIPQMSQQIADLEQAIQGCITFFENKTGLKVNDVQHIQYVTAGKSEIASKIEVTVKKGQK